MFQRNTVFVIGAGASWHYGYPTGAGLIEDVLRIAQTFDNYIQAVLNYGHHGEPVFIHHLRSSGGQAGTPQDAWKMARDQIAELTGRLRAADPLVIDYFLGHNAHLADLGRLLIAWAIHKHEAQYDAVPGNPNRKPEERAGARDNWVRFLTHRLTADCENSSALMLNKVHFITFNYDFSLERELYRSLRGLSFFDQKDVGKFLGGDRVTHVYGSVSGDPRHNDYLDLKPFSRIEKIQAGILSTLQQHGEKMRGTLDALWDSAQRIRVIDPLHKEDGNAALERACGYIANAERAYILGYGFDENNNRRIGLGALAAAANSTRAVMFTNYENSNKVSKLAGSTFLFDHRVFITSPMYGVLAAKPYFEMSVKNTYDALSLDFDFD